jgi:hypothetical protein
MRCGALPTATVSLDYANRTVVIADLLPDRDPNLLELCDEHVARMTAPVGWTVVEARTSAPALA